MDGRAYPTTIEAGDHRPRRPRRARPPTCPDSCAAAASASSPIRPRSRATSATRWTCCARSRGRGSPRSSRPSMGSPAPRRTRSASAASGTAPPGCPCGASTAGALAPTRGVPARPRRAGGGSPGRGLALLHLCLDHGARHAGVRARGPARRGARPAQSAGRRAARGQCRRSALRLLRRPLSPARPPRHDHRRAGRLSQRDARLRLRPHRGADGGLAARACAGRTRGCRGWRPRRTCRRSTPRASIRAAA